jgi:hypothetical protein
LREQGYAILPGVFDAGEARAMAAAMEQEFAPDAERLTGWGDKVLCLFERVPLLARLWAERPLHAALEALFEARFDLRASGARVSGPNCAERIPWHHHHGWGAQALAERTRFQRLVVTCYPQGSGPDLGPVIVRPRVFAAPLQEFGPNSCSIERDELPLEVAPGTVVLLDAPLVHCARRGTSRGARLVWGAYLQSCAERRTHPEDEGWWKRQRMRWARRPGR